MKPCTSVTFEVAVDTFYPSGPEELAAMSGANTTSLVMVQFSRIVKYETVRVQNCTIEFLSFDIDTSEIVTLLAAYYLSLYRQAVLRI